MSEKFQGNNGGFCPKSEFSLRKGRKKNLLHIFLPEVKPLIKYKIIPKNALLPIFFTRSLLLVKR